MGTGEEPSIYDCISGEDAFIACQVTGDEPITKTWTKSGSNSLPRSVKDNNGILEFKQISVSDQGRYVCSASNPAGTSEAVAEVVVNDDNADYTLTEKFSSRPGKLGRFITQNKTGFMHFQ